MVAEERVRSPIALFIYKRPDHLRKTLSALKACRGFEPARVQVFADGPKHAADRPDVAAARAVARNMLGDGATYHFSEENKGLAASISTGVSMAVAQHGRVIVVEDDLEVYPNFLTFIDQALDHYADDGDVYQVSGHMFEVPSFLERTQAVLLPFTTTWGWGTWARAWRYYDPEAATAHQVLENPAIRKRFNLDGTYDYASMLRAQQAGSTDSWGIRWYLSVFQQNGLSVFPPRSLVRNFGFDGSGSHGRGWLRRYTGVRPQDHAAQDLSECLFPSAELDDAALNAVKTAIWRQNGGVAGQIADAAKAMIRERTV